MCYSAMQRQAEREYERMFGKFVRDDDAFVHLFALRAQYPELVKIPRGVEHLYFMEQSAAVKTITKSVQLFQEYEIARLNADLMKAEARIQEQEEKLARKETKTARNSYEIGLRQRAKALADIEALMRPPPAEYRFFPRQWCSMIIEESGRRILTPARFKVLPRDGEWPDDTGIYNARRDSLQVRPLWAQMFGKTHAVVPFVRFFEQVEDKAAAPKPDGKQPKVEISFTPEMLDIPHPQMWSASLYAEYKDPVLGLIRSVAFVTDDPPQEVLDAGHDRCPIFLRNDHIDSWLSPGNRSWSELDAVLENREDAYYSHKKAAAA